MVVEGPRVSREHLEVRVEGEGWFVTDRSSNGSFGPSGRIGTETGSGLLVLALGSATGPIVVVSDDPSAKVETIVAGFTAVGPSDPTEVVLPATAGNLTHSREITRFGRAADNDVVLTGLLASAHHAHLVTSSDGSLEVVDLASARGTFVQGVRVQRARLTPGDRVSMGGSAFVVSAQGVFAPVVETGGVELEARGVTVQVGRACLLDDVSFSVPPGSVLAVVGPSGSGKSTLLGALAGFAPASAGRVLIGSRDLYLEYDELRFQVGLVPQADLVPAQLRVKDALEYAARLRFPRETPKADRRARVAQVMDDLALTPQADLRIDRLSGGQRKRVSVALELLTSPSMLLLDEPTSGLDPGLDRQVMVLLREMADAGRTVVVVTHAVENLALADRLLILASGGHLAYFGPPLDAPGYFGVPDMPSVFLALDTAPGPEWTRRWSEPPDRSDSSRVKPPIIEPTGIGSTRSEGHQARISKPTGTWGQFWTLTARNVRVISADRTYALLLLLLPLALAFTGFLVGTSYGLGDGPSEEAFFNPDARLLLMVLVLGSVFTGGATSIQELVKDRVIYRRERAVGLSRVAYVGSKALVLGVIAAVQGFVFAVLSLIGRPGPADPLVLPGYLDIAVIVAAATVTACMLGLLLSAFLPTRDAALPALVIATMMQVVFSGAIPLRYAALLDAVGWAMPGYWEFRGMAASTDLDALLGPEPPQDWLHQRGEWWTAAVVLVIMTTALILGAIIAAGRHDPGKRLR
jgi:ABC-type multidrug transport system ATPase subunit/pSer/pThr/pTyr-binding forkhead associated (FHA) protein